MKNHSLLYFLVFICSLVLGYSVSTRFYPTALDPLPSSMVAVAAGSQNSIETMNNGQRSILFIRASSLTTPNPQLESVWLATYFSSDTTIRLLPIFPTSNPSRSDFEGQLGQSFNVDKLNAIRILDQDFLDLLKKNNYWWSGYIVFDDMAVTKIINLLGGIDLNGRTLMGDQVVQEFPKVLDDPQDAFSSQIAILQSTCQKLQAVSTNPDLLKLISLLPNHILTDLDSSLLQTETQSLFANGRTPTCRFPTLEISRAAH